MKQTYLIGDALVLPLSNFGQMTLKNAHKSLWSTANAYSTQKQNFSNINNLLPFCKNEGSREREKQEKDKKCKNGQLVDFHKSLTNPWEHTNSIFVAFFKPNKMLGENVSVGFQKNGPHKKKAE